jgi:hypothetical protein
LYICPNYCAFGGIIVNLVIIAHLVELLWIWCRNSCKHIWWNYCEFGNYCTFGGIIVNLVKLKLTWLDWQLFLWARKKIFGCRSQVNDQNIQLIQVNTATGSVFSEELSFFWICIVILCQNSDFRKKKLKTL